MCIRDREKVVQETSLSIPPLYLPCALHSRPDSMRRQGNTVEGRIVSYYFRLVLVLIAFTLNVAKYTLVHMQQNFCPQLTVLHFVKTVVYCTCLSTVRFLSNFRLPI